MTAAAPPKNNNQMFSPSHLERQIGSMVGWIGAEWLVGWLAVWLFGHYHQLMPQLSRFFSNIHTYFIFFFFVNVPLNESYYNLLQLLEVFQTHTHTPIKTKTDSFTAQLTLTKVLVSGYLWMDMYVSKCMSVFNHP